MSFERILNLFFQLGYLIITVATGSQAFPILAIIMLSVVYGLQVCLRASHEYPQSNFFFIGNYIHSQTRIHACGMDGCVYPFVSAWTTAQGAEKLIHTFYYPQISCLQFLLAHLFFLVHGRVRLG